jgi:hypothetical protein
VKLIAASRKHSRCHCFITAQAHATYFVHFGPHALFLFDLVLTHDRVLHFVVVDVREGLQVTVCVRFLKIVRSTRKKGLKERIERKD